VLRFACIRLFSLVPLFFVVSILLFALEPMLPNDPARLVVGADATQEAYDAARQDLGLDEPLLKRYGNWLINAVRGDLGVSYFSGESVSDAIAGRLPVTLSITLVAGSLALLIGVSAGTAAALLPGSLIDRSISALCAIGIAVPDFWIAMMLAALFALALNWFPATGFVEFSSSPIGWLQSIALPSMALAIGKGATLAKQMRVSMLDVLQKSYIRTARAKGASRTRTVIHHALRNSLQPVVTVFGIYIGLMFGGALVIERVFALPGLGSLAFDSVLNSDVPVLQGVILLSVLIVTLVNLGVDLLYGWLNPKVRVTA